jgi:hypothetical protein
MVNSVLFSCLFVFLGGMLGQYDPYALMVVCASPHQYLYLHYIYIHVDITCKKKERKKDKKKDLVHAVIRQEKRQGKKRKLMPFCHYVCLWVQVIFVVACVLPPTSCVKVFFFFWIGSSDEDPESQTKELTVDGTIDLLIKYCQIGFLKLIRKNKGWN